VTAYDLIVSRRSIYEFESAPVADGLLQRCLEAAIWAPNLGLTQPWRFAVLQGSARLRAAAAVAAAEAAGDADPSPPAAGPAPAAPQPSAPRRWRAVVHSAAAALRSAPSAVAILQRLADDPAVRADDRLAVAAAVENFILCAWDEGLGSLWVGGPVARHPAVRSAVGAEEGEDLVALLAVGFPATAPPPTCPRPDRVAAVARGTGGRAPWLPRGPGRRRRHPTCRPSSTTARRRGRSAPGPSRPAGAPIPGARPPAPPAGAAVPARGRATALPLRRRRRARGRPAA
jgi:nitroreductase